MNDLISRSSLIADMENRKAITGDPVIRVIFDRLIDIVKGQPAAEVEDVVHCDECVHYVKPNDGDYLGLCTSGFLAVSHSGQIYPGRGFYCLYGERKVK